MANLKIEQTVDYADSEEYSTVSLDSTDDTKKMLEPINTALETGNARGADAIGFANFPLIFEI